MRTHWGYATLKCGNCRETVCFLVVEKHRRDGVQCQRCHRLAATGAAVARIVREMEEEAEHGGRED